MRRSAGALPPTTRSVSACTIRRRASKYSASSGPSAVRNSAMVISVADGCHGRAITTTRTASATYAVRRFRP
jgi:hypothetical protein